MMQATPFKFKTLNRAIVIKGLFILLFLLAFSPYHVLMKSHLSADDASYLAHSFTLGLDFNLDYKGQIADWINATGKAPMHPIGPGILAAPFVSIFSLVDYLTSHPVIEDHARYQFSWSYFGFVFATSFYFLMGFVLYGRSLNILKLGLNPWRLLFVCASFGILFYVLFRPTMGHSYEFFALSLCFYACAQGYRKFIYQNAYPVKYIFLCAMSMILTITIRPSNVTVILLPFILAGFVLAQSQKPNNLTLKHTIGFLLLLGAFLAICYIPIALINLKIYGAIIPNAKLMYVGREAPVPPLNSVHNILLAFSYLFTHLWQIGIILFSSEFGMVLTSSVIVFGIVSLMYFLISRTIQKSKLALFTLCLVGIYCGLPVAITLFWQSVGDAYGYRFMYGLFPLALLGYAFWYHAAYSKWLDRFVLSLCMLSLVSSILFASTGQLMYHENGTTSFGKTGGNAVGYNTAVIKALPRPSTWIGLSATRAPGFFTVGLLDALKIDATQVPIPGLEAKLEKFRHYQHPPLSVYLQALLLGGLFLGFCSLMGRNIKSKTRRI